MLPKNRTTRILLDSGDPDETRTIKSLLGSVDGQTTNPSLIARSPRVRRQLETGRKFTLNDYKREYKAIVQEISPLVGDAGVSIEVFANLRTTASEMLAQGREMFAWAPNAYIKYPCTYEGLRAAQNSVEQGLRIDITLCFSQEQAAGVYAATQTSEAPAYLSAFIGRLDDSGTNGLDLIRNIQRMYEDGDGHVSILAASIRSVDQLLACLALEADMVTAPARVLESWAAQGLPIPEPDADYKRANGTKALKAMPYRHLNLHKPWNAFNLRHDLTRRGIEKFTADVENTLRRREDADTRAEEPELLPQ